MDILKTNNSVLPLNFGIALFAPISATAGSATVQITQPLFVGNVKYAPLLVALAETFLLIANEVFHLETIPVINTSLGQTVKMPISDLRNLLNGLGEMNSQGISSEYAEDGRGFLTVAEPSAPLVVGLSIFADYTDIPNSPSTQFIVPIFEVPGLRGALPLLILTLLMTIFVRAVVSPEAAGAKPLPLNQLLNGFKDKTFNMKPEVLVDLLSRFGKYFPSR